MIVLVSGQKKYNRLKNKQKTFLLLITFLFIGISQYSTTAQSRVWLDEKHNKTTKEKGIYYRPSPKKKRSGYLVVDYYKNGDKYREGKAESISVNREKFKGIVTYYYKQGTVSKKEKYKKGQLNGLYQEYYPTGELKVDGSYDNNKKEGVWKFYYKTGKIKTKGKYRNGEKVGIWKTYYKNVYYPDDE